jgi:transmembrane sensor
LHLVSFSRKSVEMNIAKYIELLKKQNLTGLSAQEENELDKLRRDREQSVLPNDLDKIWEWSAQYKKYYEPDVDMGVSRLKTRMHQSKQAPRVKVRLWLGIAASVALLLALGSYGLGFWQLNSPMIVETTGAGQLREIRLPDGSAVTLNGNSKLEYPRRFKGDYRLLELVGEAYFNVQPNPEKPLVIQTRNALVKVLGTSFNLRAFSQENFTEVEVESGTVELLSRDGLQRTILGVREKGVYLPGSEIIKKEAPYLNAHSWRTQTLKFRKTPVTEVVAALERHFNIRIDTAGSTINQCTFSTDFENESLETALETIRISFGAEIRNTGAGEYALIGGKCE